MITGYTTGVYDLFHIGHLNLIRSAKALVDKLIVGVTVDSLVNYKKKENAFITFEDRIEIIRSLKYVDVAIPQTDTNKVNAWKKLKYDILFVGDDWYNNDNWSQWEKELEQKGVKTIYLPYTQSTSSTKINNILDKVRKKKT